MSNNDEIGKRLREYGISTVGDVFEILDRGPDGMLFICRVVGKEVIDELAARLREKGYLS